jgi:hypothetical protein
MIVRNLRDVGVSDEEVQFSEGVRFRGFRRWGFPPRLQH